MLLTVVDTETTGTDPSNDALVEIAAVDVRKGASPVPGRENEWAISVKPRTGLIKPPIPIPPEASAVHHIVDADVANALPARDVVPLVLRPEEKPIYVAHNAAFEESFLRHYAPDAVWLCTYKAALRVWPEAPAFSNQVLRYWLGVDVDRAVCDFSHRALPDTLVTAPILLRLLERASVPDMLAWTLEPPLLPRCPLNPHRNKPWSEVPVDFLMWIVGLEKQKDRDMKPEVIWNAKRELDRRANAQAAERDTKYAAERAAYVALAKQALVLAQTIADLNSWWQGEAENRAKWGIVKGGTEYNDLAQACTTHKATLPPQQQKTEQAAA